MKIQNAFRLGLIATLGVGLGLAILESIVHLSQIITYIGAALFLALGIEPIISFLERHHLKRALALVVVLVVVIGAFVGLLWAIIPIVISQGSQAITAISKWVSSGAAEGAWKSLHQKFPSIIPSPTNFDLSSVTKWITDNVGTISSGALQVGLGIATGVFGALIIVILTIYFAASLPSIKRAAYQLAPASKRARFADLSEQITDSVGKYVIGQVGLALVNGVLSVIFLSIIRAPFPVLLAAIAFLLSLIPLVGTVTGSVIIVAACLLSGPIPAIIAAVYYLVYMQVEAYFISPRVMNRAVSVPGAVVVIAALAGGSLLGILGALIAIPVAASILLIIRQVVIPRQNEL